MNALQTAIAQARALIVPRPIKFLDNTVRFKQGLRDLLVEVTSVPPMIGANARDVDSMGALGDVLEERRRQVFELNWTPGHDDAVNRNGELADAAVCYALHMTGHRKRGGVIHQLWPWATEWWKPRSRRRNLVKACALLLAEIERLDRMG